MSTPHAENAPTPGQPAGPKPAPTAPPAHRRRRWLKWVAMTLGALLVVAAGGLGGAEYYTSRPEFCGTCHVMEPYYRSWSHDIHGAKLGTRCVDCHYAPGEHHTIMAKFKGLSQVASYFTGRYGTARPRAHVRDTSCNTPACHGDNAHLTKSLPIGVPRVEKRLIAGQETEIKRSPTVQFVHEKHLRVDAKLSETETKLHDLETQLREASGTAYESIRAATRSVKPAAQRTRDMRTLLQEADLAALLPDALELTRLEHLQTRLLQLSGINCAACHSYDASGTRHFMKPNLQTCFTCHFNNQEFNRDTGACLRCHEPPTRRILVHDELVDVAFHPPSASAPAAATQPVLMDHRDIVARGIDCASCHRDVVQGEASVTLRDCIHCHDQEQYLKDFATRDTQTVAEYHRIHVAGLRAACFDCHRTIQHHLIDPLHVATSADYLRPVLNDCQHCHPDHHSEQVRLLMGVGGVGVARSMPNAMFGSRINCSACHVLPATDLKGDELIKATESTCVACHGTDYERLFQQWQSEISTYLDQARTTLSRVEQRTAELEARGAELPREIQETINLARTNIQLMQAGNGIHNKNYALALLDVTIHDLDDAMARLTTP